MRSRRLFPFLGWPRPTPASVRQDLAAGLTVALVLVPQSLAYAQLAGVPLEYGLYAAFVPAAVGVLFGSSAILSTGPVALTSLLTAASVAALVPQGGPTFYAYVTLLALLSGLFQLGFGLARAGFLLSLVSYPVLMGFINAAALIIAMAQLPALLGITTVATESLVFDTWSLFGRLPATDAMSVALGGGAMAMFYAFRRFAPALPGILITVAVLTWVSYATGFAAHGGKVVGTIPAGLPGFSVPTLGWNAIAALLPAAFVVALLSFMEAMSSAKVIAQKTRTRWDENQELIGQGLAKIAAAFCQSMPVSGSFSRSALNLAAHAKTGWSALFAVAFVLLTLLYLTPLFHHLPKPVLAAMIMLAVFNLIDLRALRRAWLASREDGIAGTATFAATLAFAPYIQNGILVGVFIALAAFLYGRMRPRVQRMAVAADGTLVEADAATAGTGRRSIAALRFDASLYFANVSFFEDAVLALSRDNAALRYVLIDASAINYIDASGIEILARIADNLQQREITLVLAGVKEQVLKVARRTGLLAALGPENVFASEQAAIASVLARAADGTP